MPDVRDDYDDSLWAIRVRHQLDKKHLDEYAISSTHRSCQRDRGMLLTMIDLIQKQLDEAIDERDRAHDLRIEAQNMDDVRRRRNV